MLSLFSFNLSSSLSDSASEAVREMWWGSPKFGILQVISPSC